MENIFVGILCIIVAVAGVFAWWYENGNTNAKDNNKKKE